MYRLITYSKKEGVKQAFANHKQEFYDTFKAKKDKDGKNAIIKLEQMLNDKINYFNFKIALGMINKPSCISVDLELNNKKYYLENYI